MSTEKNDERRVAYLDLLASSLTNHEKNLDSLVERIEKLSESLFKLKNSDRYEEFDVKIKSKVKDESTDKIVYMRIPIQNSIDDLVQILKCLKD